MKKRKRGEVNEEGISERKKKASGFVDENQNNNKASEVMCAVKGLLQKEQTRLSGLKKLNAALKDEQNKETVGTIVKDGGEFQEVFKILEGGRQNLSQLEIQTCLEILENVLLFTAEESQLSSRTGMSIVQRVMQSHLKLLYSCLNPANPPEVIKSALRLLTAMVTQGSSAAREVQRSFDFTLKSLPSLPNKRDSKSAQDVRTCFIYFCLSFLMFGDLTVMKQILELKGFLQSVMKGLQFDTPDVVHAVLSTLQGRVVQNSGITKKTKVQFFNAYVLSQLATLYQYNKDSDEENNSDEQKSDQTVRRKVHELLLKICGSFKLGICFSNTAGGFSTRSNNPVLLKFLQSLSSVTTDVLIQELLITALSCCQDVLKPLLSSLSAIYDPRLSMPWIANMNLVTKLYMALPQPSKMLEKSGLKITAEMLPSLINMVVPVGISRTALSRGVQHASSLVKHTTLSLVVVILNRAQNATGCLALNSGAPLPHKSTTTQPEAQLLHQFREEIIKALPDVTTIITLRQNLVSSKAKEKSQEEEAPSPTVLLAQSLKVIHGFQMLTPLALSRVNFDLRKLLPGQQEMALPPIAQHLTLQILLQAPPRSLNWYQQKGKTSTSFVYSVLHLYTSVSSENIKNDAKQLLWKLVSEAGLVNNNVHTNEVEIWLSHLCHSQINEGHMETLLRFLDEVFTAVAAEPYVYTDIVVDMQTEAVALEASAAQLSEDSTEWNWSSHASLPMSLLLIRALKQYSQMVCKIIESDKKTSVASLDCISRYMNCVIFDMIHTASQSAILCLAVLYYYGYYDVPEHLTVIRGLHKALLQYVSYWLPGPTPEQRILSCLKEHPKANDKNLKELHSFLDKTTVDSDNGKEAVLTNLYHLLESQSEEQFQTVIADCVDFCKHHLTDDFTPLARVLQVKNYMISGSTDIGSIALLLRTLPFSTLLWQVLGKAIQAANTTSNEVQTTAQPETSSVNNDTSSHNSWMLSLLTNALEKEPLSQTVSRCFHLLLYLRLFKRKLVTFCTTAEQETFQSAIGLCFQLLQYLLHRSVLLQQKEGTCESNEVKQVHYDEHSMFSYKPVKQELDHVKDTCYIILHHPVILNSFLWKPEQCQSHVSQDFSIKMTYNVANLLLTVLPNLTLEQKEIVMGPFVDKLCKEGMMEIESAQHGNVVRSSRVLYLLGLFHDFCNKEQQAQFISSLAQLPTNMLVTTDPTSHETTPSVFLVTLLMLLEGESLGEKRPNSSSSPFTDIPLKTQEPLSVSHFKQLIKISESVNCPQLDSTILKLLQKSLLYVLASTTSLLDTCLVNPTEVKVSVAAYLVVHSPALRSHFETCCLREPSTKKKVKAQDKSLSGVTINFASHLVEYLPLVLCYLAYIHDVKRAGLNKSRTQAVVSRLVQAYWAPLWKWLVGDRDGILNNSGASCLKVLVALIDTMQRDDSFSERLEELLLKASSWDSYQLQICHKLATSQCHAFSTNEQREDVLGKFCFACMEFLSSDFVRGSKGDDEPPVINDALSHLESICKNAVTIKATSESCVVTWNSFVTNCLRYKFDNARVLTTLRFIIKAIYKEQADHKNLAGELLLLDTLYDMVLSHSQFLDIFLSNEKQSETKGTLVELMVTVVELSPNCCKSSHLPVLFAAYSASLSTTDQSILYLLNLYERNNTSFKNYRPFLWGPAAARHHQTTKSLGPSLWQQPSVTEVLEQIDASKMYQSAVAFPRSRLLQPQVQSELCDQAIQTVYDPCFLLPLFSCLLAPNYQVDCRKFVEQGCLSFAVASLSSRDVHMRQAGYHVLSRYMMHLEGARFRERKQIFHLLMCLKNSITEANCRISSLMACFVARVANILLKPEHPFYIMMNSFLLQRPALDLRDLPLFFTMFNSSTMQHVTERSWMLQLLVDGMKDIPDYYLYKRRHVIELALSYHDSPVSDHHSQNLVTRLLLSALKIHPAAYDLTKNYGIVAWIHSLCINSPERLSTSLNLLQTLWFTLHATDKTSKDLDGEDKSVRLPPNLAQECALVCWTLLEQLGPCPAATDTCTYLKLLASVITHLATNKQPSGLSCDHIVSLLALWCAAFDETVILNQLLSSLNMDEIPSNSVQTETLSEPEYPKLKIQSLSSLLAIITFWQPLSVGTNQTSLQQTVLVVWHFGLMCCRDSSMVDKLECRPSGESQTLVSRLEFLRWFRKCVVNDCALQNRLVTESSSSEVKRLLQLYQSSPFSKATESLQHAEYDKCVESSRFAVTAELNKICLVLLAAAQRVKRENDTNGSLQPAVCQLISQEPFVEVLTKGLEKEILPLLPDPCTELLKEIYRQDQDVVLQELVSLLMQELWLDRPIPRQFLSYVISLRDSGYPVVESLIQCLGGAKNITKWIQKDNV